LAPAHRNGRDPCRDLVCPPQAAAIETATIDAPESGQVHPFVDFSAAPHHSPHETEGAVAIFVTEHGPPVRTALHSVLRL
jgi:hypothetical protein